MSQLKREYSINGVESFVIALPVRMIERMGWKEGDWLDILIDAYHQDIILQNKSLQRRFK